jgi:hypothetical protein
MSKRNKNKQSKYLSTLKKPPPPAHTEPTTSVATADTASHSEVTEHSNKKLKPRSGDANNDREAESMMVNETANNTQNIPTIWVALDGNRNYLTKIKVVEGNDIDDIQEKLKAKAPNTFAKVDAVEIQLYQSMPLTEAEIENNKTLLEKEGNALRSTEQWFSNVSWGTKEQPLIVYTPKPDTTGTTTTSTTTGSINNGKCNGLFACLSVC